MLKRKVDGMLEESHNFVEIMVAMVTIGGFLIAGSLSYLNARITNMINGYTNEVKVLEHKFNDLQRSKAESDTLLLERINQISDTLNNLASRDYTKEFLGVFVTKDVFEQSVTILEKNMDELRKRCCNDKM